MAAAQLRVLILCTANSARSQMAEGLLRHLAGERVAAFSAGTRPGGLNPYAVQAMAARGIDISQQRSESLSDYLHQPFDYVITVCDQAAESCPAFPGPAERLHWGMPDPAAVQGDADAVLKAFIEVRDSLEAELRAWLAAR